jgi:ElaB/YqjD/DUF883 family membrane-anchored ribosome-binding protein
LWHYAVQGPPGFPFLTPNKPEKSKLSFFKTVVEVAAATFGVIHCNPWRGLVVGERVRCCLGVLVSSKLF